MKERTRPSLLLSNSKLVYKPQTVYCVYYLSLIKPINSWDSSLKSTFGQHVPASGFISFFNRPPILQSFACCRVESCVVSWNEFHGYHDITFLGLSQCIGRLEASFPNIATIQSCTWITNQTYRHHQSSVTSCQCVHLLMSNHQICCRFALLLCSDS
jgi:hypothetical protein